MSQTSSQKNIEDQSQMEQSLHQSTTVKTIQKLKSQKSQMDNQSNFSDVHQMEEEQTSMGNSKGKIIKIKRPISQHKSKNIIISGKTRNSQIIQSAQKPYDQQQDKQQMSKNPQQKFQKKLSNGQNQQYVKQNSMQNNRNPINSLIQSNIINNSKIRQTQQPLQQQQQQQQQQQFQQYQKQQQQQDQNPMSANSMQSRISKNSQNQKSMVSNQNIKNNSNNNQNIINSNVRQSSMIQNQQMRYNQIDNQSTLPPVNNNNQKSINRQKTQKIEKQSLNFNKNVSNIDEQMLDDLANYTPTNEIYIPKQQFFNIDMQFALEFFLSKGRIIKEKIEIDEIPQEVIQQLILQNKVFKIQLNHLLQKMCQQGQMNSEFRNMQKKPFEKIEKFFIKKLEENLAKKAMDLEIKQKCKNAREKIRQGIRDQREEIQAELREEWRWEDF